MLLRYRVIDRPVIFGATLSGLPDDVVAQFGVLADRLNQNMARERRYGGHEGQRAERSEIMDELNALALQWFGKAFTDWYYTAGPGAQ